jgi:excisionase family DNA binding protein
VSKTKPAKLAVTIQEAAESCGVSVDVIRRAIRSGDLPASYPTSRPVVMVSDLSAWLESARRSA